MKRHKVHQIRQCRDAMEPMLARGFGLTKREIIERLLRLPEYKTMNCDSLYPLVCLAVKTYDRDFYRDPSTKRIYLTRQRLKQRLAEEVRRTHPMVGTTASARIAEALEAAEG